MNLRVSIIPTLTPTETAKIEAFMFEEGTTNIKLRHEEEYGEILRSGALHFFCLKYGLYQVPTIELMDSIKLLMIHCNVSVSEIIEIGAGLGQIGKHLGIRMTDSMLQNDPLVAEYYRLMGQPVIKYGEGVENIDGNKAVEKYKPKAVLACWVTEQPKNFWGIQEQDLVTRIHHYIFVGNKATHGDKDIFTKFHTAEFQLPGLITRSMSPDQNRIWVVQGLN